MRVLQVVEPGRDGVFRSVETLVFHLCKSCIEVDLAYSDKRGSDRLHSLVSKLEHHHGGKTLNLRISNTPGISDLPAFLRLVKMARSRNYDLIHCHSSKAGVLGRLLSRLLHVPCFYTPNAYYGMGANSRAKTWLFNAIESFFVSWGHTIHVSPEEADFGIRILGVNEKRQHFIPNAVDLATFRKAAPQEKVEWRESLGLPRNAIVLGTAGRYSPQKDPLTLYQAFVNCAGNFPNLYLAHLGAGELERSCYDLIDSRGLAKRLIRIPYLQDTSTFYRGIDAFALTSRYEGLSFAVLEALASDLPIILSEAPGNRFFSTLGLSHLATAPVGDVHAFSNRIRDWITALNRERSSNHRELAEKHFDPEKCYDRILGLYRNAVSRPSTSTFKNA